MPTLNTLTLGCKVNQYETEYVRQGLARLGYRDAADGEPAELCIVNTCTVTATAEAKSRKAIRQLARANPHAEIIVMGCYATHAADAVAAMPGVVEVITDKRQLPELLARCGVADVPTGITTFGTRHRAYVKVQDGCTMKCSYCIIPSCRSKPTSRAMDDVIDEVARLVDAGHREMVLTGIHLGHYGGAGFGDRGSGDLACLVRRIAELPGEFRVRISSIEAAEVTAELIAVMAGRPDRVCPHLHVSLQSGSDTVLRRMNRRYTAGAFLDRCRQIRSRLDLPALTADVMVGFPGETEADFAATCRVVEEARFSKVHVFRFSPRRGTPAADMPEQVPEDVKRRRAAELTQSAARLRTRYLESLVGRRLQVLVERPSAERPGVLLGTSARYAPVELHGGEELIGQFVHLAAEVVVDGRIRAVDHRGECPTSRRNSATTASV